MRYFFLLFILLTSCVTDSEVSENYDVLNVKILSLGDSYTIGEGVCENCNYPNQLIDTLKTLNPNDNFNVDIIAQTGWSTTDLINNIKPTNKKLTIAINLTGGNEKIITKSIEQWKEFEINIKKQPTIFIFE